jgi:hypothetical protein
VLLQPHHVSGFQDKPSRRKRNTTGESLTNRHLLCHRQGGAGAGVCHPWMLHSRSRSWRVSTRLAGRTAPRPNR